MCFSIAAADGFRNLIFQPKLVEQRLRAVVLSHHDQPSDDQNQTEHGQMFSSSMLSAESHLLIEVTFSIPAGVNTQITTSFDSVHIRSR